MLVSEHTVDITITTNKGRKNRVSPSGIEELHMLCSEDV
jgi:hypothetical protein